MPNESGWGPGPDGGLGPVRAACGHDVRPGAQFCTACGRRVVADTPLTAQSPPAAQSPWAGSGSPVPSVQTFQNASGSRERLLAKLAMLPGAPKLPAGLLQSLTGAWQASQQADQDFATWTQDEMTNGCTRSDHADPGYQSASGPNQQATTDKKAFASEWDPIANQYGLTAYQQAQL